MATTMALDIPQQIAGTGTWWRLDYPRDARSLFIQPTAIAYVKQSGVVEGDALGTAYLSVPAAGSGGFPLDGTDDGRRPKVNAGSIFVLTAIGDTIQAVVLR